MFNKRISKIDNVRYIAIAILILCLSDAANGQRWKLRRYEIGGGIGVTQIFGDIGGTIDKENWFGLKDIKIDETRMAFPLYLRYKLDPVYVLKVNTVLAWGNATDANSRNDRGRSFKTTLFEFSAQAEYYFIPEEKKYKSAAMFNKRGMLNNYMSFNAYLFLGIGGVYSNSKVTFTQDITSVDDIKNNNLGIIFPFGLGLKYIIDDRWLVNAELGYRYSVTDYLEGYKQTQASKHRDVYYFLTFSVAYRLKTSRRGLPSFLDRQYKNFGTTAGNERKRKPRRP
ncbi:MAG: DUF6089 family protein, partial [Bacteroidales bacterium]